MKGAADAFFIYITERRKLEEGRMYVKALHKVLSECSLCSSKISQKLGAKIVFSGRAARHRKMTYKSSIVNYQIRCCTT